MTDDELADVLSHSDDPLTLARAAVQITARRLANEVRNNLPARAADDLKKSLEEWRRTEQGFVELETTKKNLVHRDVAKALAGGQGAKFVAALDRYEAAAAKQVEVWLVDTDFKSLDPDERGRRIRAWFRERSRAARQVEAADLERAVQEEESR